MAEAFVSMLLEQLASITYQQIEKEVRLVVGVNKEVAKITSNLKSIQAVLKDADKRQVKEAIVRDWLENGSHHTKNGLVGSKIVVTTPKQEVGVMMGATTANMIHLGELSEEFCWLIFYHNALGEKERNESRELESWGKQIIKRCQGLPLVAKVLGGLMRSKKTKREWVVDWKVRRGIGFRAPSFSTAITNSEDGIVYSFH